VLATRMINEPVQQRTGICCAICERTLSESVAPDERTAGLWMRGLCRRCGDQLDVGVCVTDDGDVDDLLDSPVIQQ
jgi:hypothetical protein